MSLDVQVYKYIVVVVGGVEKSVCPFFTCNSPIARPQTTVAKMFDVLKTAAEHVFYVESVYDCGVEVYEKWINMWNTGF